MSEPQLSHSEAHRALDAVVHEHDPVAHVHVNYWHIFYALCVLTVASVIADKFGGAMGKALLVLVVLVVACLKATFVMLYFMHLKYEGQWKIALLAPTIILALAIVAALVPDIGAHYYDVQVPQTEAAAQAHGHAPAPHPAGDTDRGAGIRDSGKVVSGFVRIRDLQPRDPPAPPCKGGE